MTPSQPRSPADRPVVPGEDQPDSLRADAVEDVLEDGRRDACEDAGDGPGPAGGLPAAPSSS